MAFVAYSTKTSIDFLLHMDFDEFSEWYEAILEVHKIYNPDPKKGNG